MPAKQLLTITQQNVVMELLSEFLHGAKGRTISSLSLWTLNRQFDEWLET